ncbi:hypothetical protein VNO80_19571 [Phaseolus coccineus]|uniref:Uncharacterized protein n=1 Tax=Phaseolus coccineus TaxID=3886 RepID=A0AAN9MMG7_PHACN
MLDPFLICFCINSIKASQPNTLGYIIFSMYNHLLAILGSEHLVKLPSNFFSESKSHKFSPISLDVSLISDDRPAGGKIPNLNIYFYARKYRIFGKYPVVVHYFLGKEKVAIIHSSSCSEISFGMPMIVGKENIGVSITIFSRG